MPREEEQSDDEVDIETMDEKADAVGSSAWPTKQEKVSLCCLLFDCLIRYWLPTHFFLAILLSDSKYSKICSTVLIK